MSDDLRPDSREVARDAHEDALAANDRDRADEIAREWRKHQPQYVGFFAVTG